MRGVVPALTLVLVLLALPTPGRGQAVPAAAWSERLDWVWRWLCGTTAPEADLEADPQPLAAAAHMPGSDALLASLATADTYAQLGGRNAAGQDRRRLQTDDVDDWLAASQFISWGTGETTETIDGSVPDITCPAGKYRTATATTSDFARPGGQRLDGCHFCDRGKYGSTSGLTSSDCTAPCPRGRYRDIKGAAKETDCFLCPPGKVGDDTGLATSECNGNCPSGYYSDESGLEDPDDCKVCPTGYRGWQCSWPQRPRRGTFRANSGKIRETTGDDDAVTSANTHAYITGNAIPQGESPVTFAFTYTPLVNQDDAE